jgi:hypothetical protein
MKMLITPFSYSTTNVTSSAYVTLTSNITTSTSNLVIVDTSSELMKLAQGPVGSEVDICAFQGNGYPVNISNIYIPAGTRLALKAISGNATSGYNTVSYT